LLDENLVRHEDHDEDGNGLGISQLASAIATITASFEWFSDYTAECDNAAVKNPPKRLNSLSIHSIGHIQRALQNRSRLAVWVNDSAC
jgi:hypothetical protein